jgi:hypothetical protein
MHADVTQSGNNQVADAHTVGGDGCSSFSILESYIYIYIYLAATVIQGREEIIII